MLSRGKGFRLLGGEGLGLGHGVDRPGQADEGEVGEDLAPLEVAELGVDDALDVGVAGHDGEGHEDAGEAAWHKGRAIRDRILHAAGTAITKFGGPWMMGGDFNMEPHQSDSLCQLLDTGWRDAAAFESEESGAAKGGRVSVGVGELGCEAM